MRQLLCPHCWTQQLWAVTPPPMVTVRGRTPKWVYGAGAQCHQLPRSVVSPALRELIGSWRVGTRNKITILTKSLLFQNLEEHIPSAKSVKTHFQKVKKTRSIENCHLCKRQHCIKMLNQAGRSWSRTKPTSGAQPSFLPLLSAPCDFRSPPCSQINCERNVSMFSAFTSINPFLTWYFLILTCFPGHHFNFQMINNL